jgi:hypothetical protein
MKAHGRFLPVPLKINYQFMFTATHMDATSNRNPPFESLNKLYDELSSSEIFDGEVSVTNQDNGWCLSAHRDRRLVFEHLGEGGEHHMIPVSKERVLELWKRLIDGDIDGLLKEPWKPGYT